MSMNDINSLSHTKWNCKYHIVFAPKYRRKVFCQAKRGAIGKILRQLCEWKVVTIIAAEACPDHIHLFVEIPPKISVSEYIENQLKEDEMGEQLVIPSVSPFTGRKQNNAVGGLLLCVYALRKKHRAMPVYEEPPVLPGGSFYVLGRNFRWNTKI